jgi:spoIIIJ-associated protein
VSDDVAPAVTEAVDPTSGAESEDGPAITGARGGEQDVALLEREGDIAADYLEGLLDIADLDGDIDIDVEGNRAAVSIVGADLSKLVGPDGATLEALQELTRLAVHRETGIRSRLMLDVGGHRARRRETLTALGTATAEQVRDSGEPARLDPMTPFERKVVHDAVSGVEGVLSESEGEEPTRRIVIRRA